MGIAGTLSASNVRIGVSASEIVSIALGNIGRGWVAGEDLSIVWGVSNLAGLPFFDPRNMVFNLDPTKPLTGAYAVPHSPGIISSTADVAGDGWISVLTTTSLDELRATVQPGDLVMLYGHGNSAEAPTRNGQDAAHGFIVTAVSGSSVQVVDNLGATSLYAHDLDDIATAFGAGGQVAAAFVSRIDQPWVNQYVPETVAGNGEGRFDGLGATHPDLTAGIDRSTADILEPGKSIALHYTIANIGDADSKPVVSEITLLAADQNTLISTLQVTDPVIGAGQSIQQMADFDIPADLAEGDYFFRVQTGRVNNFDDSNAANNFSDYYSVTVAAPDGDDLPNLRLENVTLDATTIAQGETTTIRYDVINDGDGDADSSRTGFFISTDAELGDGDIFLEYDSVTVPAGSGDAEFEALGELADFAPGTYFLFAVADYNSMLTETNESDNSSAAQMLVITANGSGPAPRDVVATGLDADVLSIGMGDEVELSFTIENIGTGTVSGGTTGIYLSPDDQVTEADLLLGTLPFGTLAEDDSEAERFNFDFPDSLAPGTYHIAAIADHENRLEESNEANNRSNAITLTVTGNGPPPDQPSPDVVIDHRGSTQGETIATAGGDDTVMTGSGGDDVATGRGDDLIDTGAGHDRADGGAGNDRINLGAGNDTAHDPFGSDRVTGGAGDDRLTLLSGSNEIDGGAGGDLIFGGIGNDIILGGADDDVIIGDIGALYFGTDVITGGSGDDLLDGGGGADRFVFRPGDGADVIARLSDASGQWAASDAGFQSGLDRIVLSGFSIDTPGDAFDQVSIVDGHATFVAEDVRISFFGLSLNDLSATDFEIA